MSLYRNRTILDVRCSHRHFLHTKTTKMHASLQLKPFKAHRSSHGTPVRHTNRSPASIVRAASSGTALDKPKWTGDTVMSKIVNFIIETPAIYNVLKFFARRVILQTAQKQGIDYQAIVQRYTSQLPQLTAIQAELTNPDVKYLDYYLVPFHAYDKGNLEWKAAFEVEPATYSVALRTFKKEGLNAQVSYAKLRAGFTDLLRGYLQRHDIAEPGLIYDMGCSVGLSSRWMAQEWPQAQVIGLDPSTYFLAIAEQHERQQPATDRKRVIYQHGLAESTGLADNSVDIVHFMFVIHECPGEVIQTFFTEAKRILKPGGVLMFGDNNPKSETIQNLPPAIFTMMKSTEPHSDSYYAFDMQQGLRDAGFRNVEFFEADHRHACHLAMK